MLSPLSLARKVKTLHLIVFILFALISSACEAAVQETVHTQIAPLTETISPSETPDAPAASATPTPSATPSSLPPVESPSAIPEPEVVRFAVIGDYGLAGDPLARVADLVKSWQPDFIVTTGDNNYPSGAAETIDENIGQYFHEYIYPYTGSYGAGAEINRFFPILGNHDVDTADGQAYFDYFTLPGNERYYDFTWGAVHFFALNSDWREPDGIGRSSVQAAWLQEGLAASTSPWKLVFLHTPPYSSAIQGSHAAVQWPFKEWGATAVLAGHDHVYERLEVDGLPYITNGLGGGPRYEFTQNILPESKVRYRDSRGAMLVEASQTSLWFRFITVDGVEIDSYLLGQPDLAEPQPPAEPVTRLPDPREFRWQVVVSSLNSPVGLAEAEDGSERVFIVEQPGRIRILQDGELLSQTFLDIRERVGAQANEQGLLGLAFHPRYAENNLFYVNYTDRSGNTVVSRFNRGPDTDQADPGSEERLLYVQQPYGNHNGGHILFGPDGYLYIGMGDGGAAGDPQGNAQKPGTWLGKILRIDVDSGQPFAIPPDNPFRSGEALPEIWMLGLRNPWRFDFDPLTGGIFIADVGQNQWEEVNYLLPDQMAGANLGWVYREGSHPFEGQPPSGVELVDPVAEYNHSLGCSVTGGVVVRGIQLVEFRGVYLYADFCSGRVWGLLQSANGAWLNEQLFQVQALPTAFLEDSAGNVFLADRQGVLYLLERIP